FANIAWSRGRGSWLRSPSQIQHLKKAHSFAVSSGSHALRTYTDDAGVPLAAAGRTLRGHAARTACVCRCLWGHLKMRGFVRWTGCSGCIDQRPASLARTRPVTSPMWTPVRSERGCIAGDRSARATDGVPHATAKRLEQVPRRSRTGYDIDRGDRDGPVELTPKIAVPTQNTECRRNSKFFLTVGVWSREKPQTNILTARVLGRHTAVGNHNGLSAFS